MKEVLARVAALSVIATGLAVGSSAHAGPVPPGVAEGRRCTFSAVTNPDGEGEDFIGQINAGPLAATAAGASIQITCTIQVGGANSTHGGTDADFVTSTVSTQVASIPPTDTDEPPTINYTAGENVPVFLCTEAIINGASWYWDATVVEEGPVDQLDTGAGWTASPTALCNEAIRQEIFPGPAEPVLLLLDTIICPVLAILFPPEGDIPGLWDCPEYGNVDPGNPLELANIRTLPTTAGPDPEWTGPDGWACTGAWNVGEFVVTCNHPEGSRTCRTLSVTVNATGAGPGSLEGTSLCSGAGASAFTNAPGSNSDEETVTTSTPWTCHATPTGNAEPWSVTCTLT